MKQLQNTQLRRRPIQSQQPRQWPMGPRCETATQTTGQQVAQ